MANVPGVLEKIRASLVAGVVRPRELAEQALAKGNQNAGRNVYLSLNKDWTLSEVDRVQSEFRAPEKPPLFGLPVSLKDCFDLTGFRTTGRTP